MFGYIGIFSSFENDKLPAMPLDSVTHFISILGDWLYASLSISVSSGERHTCLVESGSSLTEPTQYIPRGIF